MRLSKVKRKYPERFIILIPLMRDVKSNKPLTFRVLKECWNYVECEHALTYYENEGFPGVFAFPNFADGTPPGFTPERTAQMFRVLNGCD